MSVIQEAGGRNLRMERRKRTALIAHDHACNRATADLILSIPMMNESCHRSTLVTIGSTPSEPDLGKEPAYEPLAPAEE